MRKSKTLLVALLAAVAASGASAWSAHADGECFDSAEFAGIKRAGFGSSIEPYWPLALFAGYFLLLSRFGGGE
jgi:hypothetical protein